MPDLDAQVLALWEAGIQSSPAWRSARLLAAQSSGMDPIEAERAPIGVRDAALLHLREQLFGPHLDCVADCPRCRVPLEFALDKSEILAALIVPVDFSKHLLKGEAAPVQLLLDGSDSNTASSANPTA